MKLQIHLVRYIHLDVFETIVRQNTHQIVE